MCIVVSLYIAESVGNNKHLRVEAFTERSLKVLPFIEKKKKISHLRGTGLDYNAKVTVNRFCNPALVLNTTRWISPEFFNSKTFYNVNTSSRAETNEIIIIGNFTGVTSIV
jgi:hypothetical protein